MGHQESYIRMEDSKDFDMLVKTIQDNGIEKFVFAEPVMTITLLKTVPLDLSVWGDKSKRKFNAGEKFIYVVGERQGQRGVKAFFENCKDVPNKIIEEAEIIFEEYLPTDKILDKMSGFAKIEPFVWTKKAG